MPIAIQYIALNHQATNNFNGLKIHFYINLFKRTKNQFYRQYIKDILPRPKKEQSQIKCLISTNLPFCKLSTTKLIIRVEKEISLKGQT